MDSFFKMVFFCFLLLVTEVGAGNECLELRCRHNGPAIRFPFWLRDRQADGCAGYPGFNLSCTEMNDTVLELPFSVRLFVEHINYKSQAVRVIDPHGCFPKQLPNLNLSASPFHYFHKEGYTLADYTILKCSSRDESSLGKDWNRHIFCWDVPGYQVYAIYSQHTINDLFLSSCTKMYNFSSVPHDIIYKQNYNLHLKWSKPVCGHCEAQGKRCGFKYNIKGTEPETQCFPKPPTDTSKKIVVAGGVVGSFLLVIVLYAFYHVYSSNKIEKENQVKIEKFLEDYKALKPARYSYADLKRITNQFREKLGQGGYGTVFKGKLSDEVLVAVKILNETKGNGEEFVNEVGTMSRIHHVNVVHLVGFCADGFRRALVYEFSPNESLEKFIFSTDDKNCSLSWGKLHDIALGIAKGIEYLHQGCDQRILHLDIKPHNILLDHNFNPKISDFGMAKLCSKNQSAVSMTAARGTMGYIAPEVLSRNFGHVSYKSDVYSFGMLLLEIVGGRKNNVVKAENTSQSYFPEWIYNQFNQGEELRIRIVEESDAEIAKRLAIVGLWCIQWCPVNRPSMKEVVQMLEGEGDNLTMPPNPFATAGPMRINANNTRRPLHQELEVISEISECTS